ncbi:MAG: hypothetical protein MUE41_05845 [Gemmatimonadaceae bacterium]|nr:hypothetical protein [Gemmatimonadaceae bacterium]
MSRRTLACLLLAAASAPLVAQRAPRAGAPAVSPDTSRLKVPRWRHIGPDGNRVIAVHGVPGNPKVYYAGAASGGLWKSVNGGVLWTPLTDSLPASSISAIAVSPSRPATLYIGTGETFIRSNISIGNGAYRSDDGGLTWRHVGLERTGRIGRMVVHPTTPDVAYAAALGHGYGPQQDRGVFRTRDGGKSWQRVLFVNDSTGAIDIAIDPVDPNVLLAAMWQWYLVPWDKHSGGAGSGLWLSRDGGDTWTRLDGGADGTGWGRGLPKPGRLGKIGVGIAPSDARRMYALIEMAPTPAVYRSDDGGRTWRQGTQQHDIMERPQYYGRFAVSPADPDRLFFVSVRFSISIDGGLSLVPNPPRMGGDLHDIWIDPTDTERIVVGDDGGVGITLDGGKTVSRISLPIAQMYHVTTDTKVPYNVYGNRQDGWSYGGPSNSRGTRSIGVWSMVGGCESGWAIPDTVDNRTVWSGCYDAGLERFDLETKQWRAVEPWPESGYGVAPKDMKYRWQWTFPIHISPHDHNTVYVGSQFVHRTRNGGQSWQVISPDLSTNDTTTQGNAGGVVVDNLYVESTNVLFAIAESPLAKGTLWAGTMDGLVHLSRDGGETWTNVTAAIPGLPRRATISGIEPSTYDAGTAYLAVDGHLVNDRDPYIYRTTDFGRSWTRISGDLPRSVFSYVHVVREDPVRRGMLYAGTENGVYVSLDDGAHWAEITGNMPHSPVHWLTVQGHFHDLVVATYGRGFWIADDISALRAADGPIGARGASLLAVRAAYRFRRVSTPTAPTNSMVGGEDPPYGASLNVLIARPAAPDTLSRDSLQFRVFDAEGRLIRRFTGAPPRVGLNRVWWDLRHQGARTPRLRVGVPRESWQRVADSRPLVPWDLDIMPGLAGPLVAPGRYTVALLWRGDTLRQSVEVRRDPTSAGTDADIAGQVAMALQLRDAISETSGHIDDAQWARRELEQLRFVLRERTREARDWGRTPGSDALAPALADSVTREARALEERLIALEGRLYNVHLSGGRSDSFRDPNQLYEKFAALATDIATASADFGPTDQHREVGVLLRKQLDGVAAELTAFRARELAAFRTRLERSRVPPPTPVP